jgi:hypothetical protein
LTRIYQPVKIVKGEYVMKTKEGAVAYKHAINSLVEFFSKAGSVYTTTKKGPAFYAGGKSALDLFIPAWKQDAITSFKLLMWLRDCRGGAGNRSGARSIITWLAKNHPEWIKLNMHLIPVYGRWDDLTALFKTSLRNQAGAFWADAIDNGDILAAKWAKRHHKPTRHALGLKESEFRKMLARIRKDHIVEHLMCQNQWNKIDYKKVPSVAMARYTKAFDKRDHERFQEYKSALIKGTTTVHANVLFPHDCIITALHGDSEIAEAQFNALPNYLEGTNELIMVLCDSSASMQTPIGGSVQAIHVSKGMALYCSSRMPENSPFYKRFIGFESESSFIDWRDHTFSTAIRNRRIFDGAIGSTRIDKAMDLILSIATKRKIKQELMPTTLLIVSDMQFSQGVKSSSRYAYGEEKENQTLTEIEKSIEKWNDAGYETPKIVYWNTAAHDGQQATVNSENVGLVSGFSPSICKAIFGGEDFSPYGIMLRALEKYDGEILIPTKKEY